MLINAFYDNELHHFGIKLKHIGKYNYYIEIVYNTIYNLYDIKYIFLCVPERIIRII